MSSSNDGKLVAVDSHERASSSTSYKSADTSLLASLKPCPRIAGWCFALTSGILLYGYDLVIVGNVSSMPEFQRDFGRRLNGKLIIPSLWLGLWNIANPIGGIFGALAGGYVQDRAGRRWSLAVASVISAVGVAVAYVSNFPDDITGRRSIFFVAKVVQGFAVNMVMCTTQTYMSEILPPVLRGPILAFFPIFTLLGQLLGSIVVHESLEQPRAEGYRRCFISEFAFSAMPLVVAVLMPESPAYLVRRDRLDAARRCQRRLSSSGQDSNAIVEQIRLSIELEKQDARKSPGYLDCFRGINRRRTMIVLFANLVPSLFGLTLLAKGSYFMQTVGMSADKSLVFLQVGIGLGLAANLISMVTVSKFGRVPLTMLGLTAATFLWTGMGVAGCFSGDVTMWYTSVSLNLVITICGFSTWPASYAFGSEASSLELRAKSQGLGWLVNCVANGVLGLVLPYIFNDDEGALRAKTGFIYTGFCLIALAVTWAIVPEMKNRTPMEIDRMFELGLPARKFKSWCSADGTVSCCVG